METCGNTKKVKPKKLSFNELFNSARMFYVNPLYEENIKKKIDLQADDIVKNMSSIRNKKDLQRYVEQNEEALTHIVTILDISTERFKRIISLIRKTQGYKFKSEWDLPKIRRSMMENSSFMDKVIELLWDGKNNLRYQTEIPGFYLDNFCFDQNIFDKLKNVKVIREYVKRAYEGEYSNKIGKDITNEIEKIIKPVCIQFDLNYEQSVRVRLVDRNVSFLIGSKELPRMIIDVSYAVTTSSAQTKRKNEVRKTHQILQSFKEKGNNIIYINYLDGAGWIARQSDMEEIFRCSDYVINYNNIDQLKDIIEYNHEFLKGDL